MSLLKPIELNKVLKPLDLNKILNKTNKEEADKGNKTLKDMKKMIENAEKIAIFTHESPDGDAIGSTLAVYLALEQIGKKPVMYMPEHSRLFDFLPAADKIKNKIDENEVYDLAIALDCADLKRLEGHKCFENAENTMVIDHHGTNNMYGDLNFVNSVSPACAQILITILQFFEIEITKEIGTCLVTGIITDTGGFQYQGVTPETYEFAGDLQRVGVEIPDISSKVLGTRTRANFELLKRIVDRMEIIENGKIAFTYINEKDEEEVKAEPGDHEGLVDVGRSIEGVEISVFLRQKKDGYKISLRSKGEVNVSDICYLFGRRRTP